MYIEYLFCAEQIPTIACLPVSTLRKVGWLVWQAPPQRFFQSESLVAITHAIQSGVIDSNVAVYLIQAIHHK